MSAEKERFELDHAIGVAEGLLAKLTPACKPGYCMICGSVRRLKPDVGDIEIVYVPRIEMRPDRSDFFELKVRTNVVDELLETLERERVLGLRRNVLGRVAYGPQNKLMRHIASRIPIDFFATTKDCFWNYVVCRTGPGELNEEIAKAARRIGLKWTPTSPGFERVDANDRTLEVIPVFSEKMVFDKVGFRYQEPPARTLANCAPDLVASRP